MTGRQQQQQQPDVQSPDTAASDRLAASSDADQLQMDAIKPQGTFSIATPLVTNTSRIGDSLDEASFPQSASSYHPAGAQYMNLNNHNQLSKPSQDDSSTSSRDQLKNDSTCTSDNIQQPPPPQSSSSSEDAAKQQPAKTEVGPSAASYVASDTDASNSVQLQPDETDNGNKQTSSSQDTPPSASNSKKKGVRKGAKLDTKSKLEKSRQSARECRARKKLRYQYLEDLVCNREKAVVKLREELSMFCEMSRRIDEGSISAKDRDSLIEQTKENSKT